MIRRHFLKNAGSAAGALLLAGTSRLWARPLPAAADLAGVTDDSRFWELIRTQFLFPEDYTYLNTGGIGAVPVPVLREVRRRLEEDQLHPAPGHDHSRWEQVKTAAASLLGPSCGSNEIALISTATEGINIVINGLPLRRGDEVITSAHEHPALCIPLLNRMQRDGIKIKVFEPDMQHTAGNTDRIERLISPRTRLIFISHITCTTGQRFPVADIGRLARARGIWFGLDGAQAAGAESIEEMPAATDFYTFSGHKWLLGPKRTGVLFIREKLLDTVRPLTTGAYSDSGYDLKKQELTFHGTAQRFEFGTQNAALFEGMRKGVSLIQTVGVDRVSSHNRTLAEAFYTGLERIAGTDILSPAERESRSAMISFKPQRGKGNDIASLLSGTHKIRVRHVPEAGLDGVRVSFHIHNTEADVERILAALRQIIH